MNASEDKIVPSTWIPWIMALAVVFGWSAFAPDHLVTRKEKSQDEVGLLHQSDDIPAPGISAHPLAGLLPDGFGNGFLGTSAELLVVEASHELPSIDFRRGEVQGRAPPTRA